MEPDHHGKWAKFHPAWDAFYTFLFTPGETTRKGSHIRDGIDLKRTMFVVVMAMIPCLLFGIYNTGHWHYVAMAGDMNLPYWEDIGGKILYGSLQVLPIVIVSYGVGLGVEFIFAIRNGHAVQEGFLVTGMLIPLVLPADIPLWMVAFATVFAVVLGKEVFGGTGMNIVNVALTARAFLFFSYPTMMSGDKVWLSGLSEVNPESLPDGFSGATPLGELATMATGEPVHASMDAFAAKWNLFDCLMGYIPGSIGETSFIMIMIGAAILLYTGIASWKIMLSYFAGGFAIAVLLNATATPTNMYMTLDPIYHMVLGGFAFGGVFMITDPVSASQTSTGKFIYGFLAGAMAIVIRVLNPAFPEGVMMAILLMNVLAPLIDHYVIQANIKRRMKRLKTA